MRGLVRDIYWRGVVEYMKGVMFEACTTLHRRVFFWDEVRGCG